MKLIDLVTLFGTILLCQLAGAIGSIFTINSISTWYVTLNKPFFTPQNWIFGPAWITLYTIMGISLFIILKTINNKEKFISKNKVALFLFGLQLIINTIWSIIFFGLQNIFLGMVTIITLWFIVALTVIKFYKINQKAGILLIPYLVWLSFATILNISIFLLN
jgi:translocator protein